MSTTKEIALIMQFLRPYKLNKPGMRGNSKKRKTGRIMQWSLKRPFHIRRPPDPWNSALACPTPMLRANCTSLMITLSKS